MTVTNSSLQELLCKQIKVEETKTPKSTTFELEEKLYEIQERGLNQFAKKTDDKTMDIAAEISSAFIDRIVDSLSADLSAEKAEAIRKIFDL